MADRLRNLPKGMVDVPTTAAGPSHKIERNKDGTNTMLPGSAHEAKDGKVITPGVRTVSTAGSGPICPQCSRTGTLKMHMNKKSGQRIYCTSCGYDQSKLNEGATGTKSVSSVRQVDQVSGGVKVLRQRGPR